MVRFLVEVLKASLIIPVTVAVALALLLALVNLLT